MVVPTVTTILRFSGYGLENLQYAQSHTNDFHKLQKLKNEIFQSSSSCEVVKNNANIYHVAHNPIVNLYLLIKLY